MLLGRFRLFFQSSGATLCGVKKVSKAILISFSVLVVLGIALVVGLNLYIQSPGSQARIQEELSKSLRLPLKLTNVSVSPMGRLRITGITIPNGGANFLDAAAFNATYRLLPLLHGKLIIPEMSVQNPKVVWVQTADGKWKLPEPQQAAKTAANEADQTTLAKEPKAAKSNFVVIVERFNVEDGTVELLDHENKHVAVFSDVKLIFTSLSADRVEGTATIGKIVWADSVTFEKISTPFQYKDGAFNLPEISAAFAGGTVTGRYTTHTEKSRNPFKVALTLNKLDLNRLSTQLGSAADVTMGTLTGQVEWFGDAQSDRYQGEGHLDLRDAQFHQLDLFQNIGEILGMRELSDLRVKDGHSDLRLSGEKITVEKLVLNTSDLQLAVHGTARLDKKLNLTAQLSAADDVIQRLPAIIRDSFAESVDGRRAIDFDITGNTDKPKTNLLDKFVGRKINSQFGDVLNAIFGGKPDEAKKDEKKSDKDHKKKDKSAPPNATPAPATPAVSPDPTAPATPAPPPPQPAAAGT